MTTEPHNILIIDDDEVDRMALIRVLKNIAPQAKFAEAGGAEQTRQMLAIDEFQCIFMDYMMPDSDGKQLLEELRETGVDIPIIVLTGHGDERLAVTLIQAGASDYIPKVDVTDIVIRRSLHQAMRFYEAAQETKRAHEEQQMLLAKLHETQGQLMQADKMASIGQLAAGVAHEINNPVGYIYSNISSLANYINDLFTLIDTYERAERQLHDDDTLTGLRALKQKLDLDFLREDVTNLLNESQEGVTRVKQIVQDLKDFSHADGADWQWADLHKGLDSTLNIVRNEIKYKAEVVKHYGELPAVQCMVSQLNQVFMNLLVNAAHSIEDHGVITLTTGVKNDDWVWVKISDTGGGIPPDMLHRIFDPFFTTKPVGQGTGLGLSLSYGIIKKHGGHFNVDSTVGEGTTFTVTIPVRQQETQGDAA